MNGANSNKGFTLIELVVGVVLFVALVVVIPMSVYQYNQDMDDCLADGYTKFKCKMIISEMND